MKPLLYLLDLLFPPRQSQLVVDSLLEEELIKKVRIGKNIETGIMHLLPYSDQKVRACVREAKFHQNERAHALLGSILLRYMKHVPSPYVLIPVPLSDKRRRKRGYNQVEEVIRAAKLPFSPILKRIRDTPPQTLVPKHKRADNVADSIVCATPLSPIPIYVVLDDVSTTGATLKAAEAALKQAGAVKILLVSLAH